MNRINRVLVLAAFASALLVLWAHDIVVHEPSAAACGEGACHACKDPAHDDHGPCTLCCLASGGLTVDRPERAPSASAAGPAEAAVEAGPAPVSFLSSIGPRGPPPR